MTLEFVIKIHRLERVKEMCAVHVPGISDHDHGRNNYTYTIRVISNKYTIEITEAYSNLKSEIYSFYPIYPNYFVKFN